MLFEYILQLLLCAKDTIKENVFMCIFH